MSRVSISSLVKQRSKIIPFDLYLLILSHQPKCRGIHFSFSWLAKFAHDAMRYPVLLVHAPSYAGKSEWAVSLFKRPLYVEIGAQNRWPARMKKLDRSVHDGLVLDDLRDLSFLEENQEKLQGKYNRPVELFNTPGGELAVTLDLFRLPMVFTINDDTKNLKLLETSDFLQKRSNVCVLSFKGRPGESPPSETLLAREREQADDSDVFV